MIHPDNSTSEYEYDTAGLLNVMRNKRSNGTVMDSYTYTYDAERNQTAKVEVINGVTKGRTDYLYNSLNMLQRITEPGGRVTNYTYDKAGNRLSETDSAASSTITYTYNEQNRLLRTEKTLPGGVVESMQYSYDNNGNMIYTSEETRKPAVTGSQPTLSGYIAGESVNSKVSFYQYDGLNQMIQSSVGDKKIDYRYNGEGLRYSKKVNGATTKYLYEYDKIVLEVNGANEQI